jgi:hypothetical protein
MSFLRPLFIWLGVNGAFYYGRYYDFFHQTQNSFISFIITIAMWFLIIGLIYLGANQ